MSRTVFVTGASGQLGRAVLEELVKSGTKDRIVVGSRTPEKVEAPEGVEVRRIDFDDPSTLDAAFQGVDRLLIISTDAVDTKGTRARQHSAAIDAARRAGVKHVLYTSAPKADSTTLVLAPDHKATEEALAQSGLGYTVLRHNWYAQLLLASLPVAVKTGQLHSAAGDGRTAYLTREDCAAADAAALLSDFDGKRILEITGPEALSANDIARIASEVTGKPINTVQVNEEQFAQGAIAAGVPEETARFFAALETNTREGALDIVTDHFEKLTGRKPTTVKEFLEANRAALG